MSWTNELYEVYEQNYGKTENGPLPVAHSTANAQIELTIDENGNFVTARPVDKSEAMTIIPVTEDSGARTSGIIPMPFADKLVYLAKDYGQYFQGKNSENENYFKAYMDQLKGWLEFGEPHPAVQAVYAYLEKGCIMKDLVSCGILKLSEETGLLKEKVSIAGIAQEDSFVRFRVNYSDLFRENRTWMDQSLYESFVPYNESLLGEKKLCYASGKLLPATYKHPSKIRNSGDKAKLISSNDETGLTYRGRFRNKEDAISVSYDFSQKIHNALKWLIQKQGMSLGSLTVLVWASALQPVPDIRKSFRQEWEDDIPEEEAVPDTEPIYLALLKKRIFGYREKLKINTKVMLMGLDSATTGRLSIAMYSELDGSAFCDHIENWHKETCWFRYDGKLKQRVLDSFSVYDIAKCAYGTERNNGIECDDKVMQDTILRLIPCITEGRPLPGDIVRSLVIKASNPLAYDKAYNHRMVLETACGMIRKNRIDQAKSSMKNGEEVVGMSYDPKAKMSRDYLFGCLLAIADKLEYETYEKEERDKRITNARRYWKSFSVRPALTWQRIEGQLRPYLNKLRDGDRIYYDKMLNDIMERMTHEDFCEDRPLGPEYLLGYHQFMAYRYPLKKKDQTTEDKEEE